MNIEKPKDFNLDELVLYVQGTCKTLTECIIDCYGSDYDDEILTIDDQEYIDQEIFECSECGWWCETSESNDRDGDNVCNDCYSE